MQKHEQEHITVNQDNCILLLNMASKMVLSSFQVGPKINSLMSDITHREGQILMTLGDLGGKSSMHALAKELGIKPATMTLFVEKLIKKGFLKRLSLPGDRRVVQVTFTQAGCKLGKAWEDFNKKLGESLMSPLNKKEQQQFYNLILKIYTRVMLEK